MKINTSKLSQSNTPPFWVALILGFSVAMVDNYIGFPIAFLLGIFVYYLCMQFNWSTLKINE